ncbi:PREDICTED: LOW QUALITY PROTEIN: girdin-like [Rhinopithecus bieti]|uniref:LOW QUALITY PROTEIN: girdin-like n=1 Tax=Rhinopithecus bieti TaxID=61621 RepID=UPI00083C1119|nr:PREDICTED: LOW QUALITY PROTEIN: girdin-like [Rhinopithecus bieti]
MVQSSPPISGEDNKWERESQETTRELLKVKDRLIEVERNNATLQAEKQALKTQLKQLETQNSNLQAQILALQRQIVSLQEQNTTLQTQNAKLQVENSTLNSQSTSLMNQNAQLLIQQSSLENENESVIKEREDLKSLYDSLIKDHEKLELLHERQASEYESLISKHGTLKSAHKNLEVEHRDLEDRYNQLLKQKGQLEDLEKMLKVEQEKMLLENKNHETVAAEYKKLCGENDSFLSFPCFCFSSCSDIKVVALKRLPFLRNRPKDKDKMKACYRRSMSMNDLVQSMVLAGQWTGSTENLEVPDDISMGKRRKELGAMAFSTTAINFSTVNSSAGFRSKQLVNNKDTTSFEDISPQGVSDDSSTGSRVHASRPASLDSGRTSTSNSNNNASLHEVKAVNNQSRPQSHSSGEFSLLHDHEAWSSSGSSPIQYLKRQTRSSPVLQHKISETLESRHHKIKTGSPGSEVVTLQQFLEESNKLTSIQIKSSSQENLLDEVMKSLSVSSDFLGKDKPVSCGLARSVSGKTPGDFYDRWTTKPEFLRPGPRKTEDTYFISSAGKPTPGTQGKIKLVKESSLSRQSKDSNPYATLPRASSVISTAEGTTRRTSIHDFLTKDSRLPISVDSSPAAADSNTTAASNVDKVQESRNSKSRSREQQSS